MSMNTHHKGVPDFVPGSRLGETARFFGLQASAPVLHTPVAVHGTPGLVSPQPPRGPSPREQKTPSRTLSEKGTLRSDSNFKPITPRRLFLTPNNNSYMNVKTDTASSDSKGTQRTRKSKVNTRKRI